MMGNIGTGQTEHPYAGASVTGICRTPDLAFHDLPSALIAVPRTPVELRAMLSGYLRSRGYEQATVAGEWIHRDTFDTERLTFDECVTRELALGTPAADPEPTHLHADQFEPPLRTGDSTSKAGGILTDWIDAGGVAP